MCLAVPAKVLSVEGDTAQVDFGGASRAVNVSLVRVVPGQYVIVHAGFAISVMDEAEAMESLETWREFLEFQDQLDSEEGA
ncbi:MAG: HypC/HybG/HupF family hydrogenase formation chaperone [Thermoplasmata archaeon]|nr:HypC/HybG/HupF family hydrogenase formation chaperone [Thermoplasmata archaeon]NIS10743.1 HypC/HybG/HupF family hydrogenase formation chaperone [Thermoplasmata archaeon]NIS18683.1 HypC/HybG/HupF family hydrogenase formation chaperone [Thermoplasmata archaeon]NIT75367.1 HypC/HybG/HupF family hydrogenase formation chaperone [Thermoplasmata archaeon]NIU47844.1 HypC/HybG/HupF family hydrogenase formation chaperone [Thermoplasmata archaeon]